MRTDFITGLPSANHTANQLAFKAGAIFWSVGSASNTAIQDTPGFPPGLPQPDIPCRDIVLSNFVFSPSTGQAFECPDAACSGAPPDTLSGFSAIGTPPQPGATVPAFTGAAAPGICTGAILQASLADPQHTIQPLADGFRNPFGIRFAPPLHPLQGQLVVTENGEDIRGGRPVANAPDRLRLALPGSYHGWPDRFGFFDSTQGQFNPTHFGAEASGVPPVLAFQPAPVTEPIAFFAKDGV